MPDHLTTRIDALEAELRELRSLAQQSSSTQTKARERRDGASTDRRAMLRRIAFAGASAATGVVAGSARPAHAATGDNLLLGYVQGANNMTLIGNGASPAVLGPSLAADPTMFWVDNRRSPRADANGLRADGKGEFGVGVWGNVDGGDGLLGTGAVGLRTGGTRASLALTFNGRPPSQRTDYHAIGEVYYDDRGDLWLCTSGGYPGSWRKMAGPWTAGQFYVLPAPVRCYDSRVVGGYFTGAATRTVNLQSGTSAGSSVWAVPPGSSAALVSLTLTSTAGAGYLSLYRDGATYPGTSNANWYAAGQTIAVTTLSAVSPASRVSVRTNSNGRTHVIVDVLGYWG